MRLRTISAVVLAAGALVLSAAAANASGSAGSVPLRASQVVSHATSSATHAAQPARKHGLCHTRFGHELPTVDGVISWNSGDGSEDNGGAADFVCHKARDVNEVDVYGYFGAASETFHVTFYGNSSTDGSNEPDDSNILCDYTSVIGTAGGQYPTHVLTTLTLPSSCSVPAGINWVRVQDVDAANPWYWELQVKQKKNAPDWDDIPNAFGTGCTVYNNDEYLVNCLGYDYGDWMMMLH